MKIKERAEEIFEALKKLSLEPTPPNVSILHGVYEQLRLIYQEAEEMENGRTETDPERQPED